MKKISFVILAIVLATFLAYVIPVTQNNMIPVHANFVNLVPQLDQIKNWKNWYPEIKEAYSMDSSNYSFIEDASQKDYTISIPEKKYFVHQITPMSYQVNVSGNTGENAYAFVVLPSTKQDSMSISITSKTSLLGLLFNKRKTSENAIIALKSYFEDVKVLYGFDISMSEIRNPIIASIVVRTTRSEDIFPKIKTAYLNLNNYAKTNGLTVIDHPSISYTPLSKDSLNIVVGIPVNRSAPAINDVNCLLLPAKGRVLTANYEGKFADREKIYQAMSRYMSDNHLSMPAVAFERYMNDSVPSSDSSAINIELNFPVY